MAYAALNSLLQTIEKTPQPAQQIITSFKEKVARLLAILDDSSPQNNLTISNFEAQIRDASYHAEDLIESYMLNRSKVLTKSVSAVNSYFQRMISSQTFDQEFQGLEKMMKEFDSILEALSKMNDEKAVEDDLQPSNSLGSAGPSRSVSTSTRKSTNLVGVDEDLFQLKDRLTGQPSQLDIISIVGMGGIGKTTLVRNLYNDSLIQQRFDIRAWTVVSQEYNMREMLRRLLDTTRHVGDDKLHEKSTEQLAELLYKSLKGRRYLIVIDDVWVTKAWDDVRRCFPDDNNGSRIISTTRLSEIATYINSSRSVHHMNLMSLTSSWNLLCKLVFGEEKCPSPLEEVGMRIANSCKGLPLAITVVGGILSKGSKKTPGYWKHIAQNVKSSITENDDQFMEILSFSYKYLPPHLKACFLYIGGFPEDHVIFVSQLIKLWVAEGFIKPLTSKSLEDVAEDYLKDLVERNLIMVHKRKHNGGIKTCIIHDMLRGLCIRKARDEKFLQIMDWGAQVSREGKLIRSVLYFSKCHSKGKLPFTMSLRMLRVLDALGITFSMFPREIFGLVHLKYLAFVRGFSNTKFPTTLSKLLNLQTLIVYGQSTLLYLPLNVWEMPQLRHILFDTCFLPYPFNKEGTRKYSNDLENLQTLSEVQNFRCTRKICEILPNLKKLGLSYFQYTDKEWSSFEFNNFAYLHQLETLKIRFIDVDPHPPSPLNFSFPPTLKKLTLSGCKVPWEKMSIVGMLPNLEVLKLLEHAFYGSVWEPNEGEFSKLKFLLVTFCYMRQWKASNTHFPCLQHLRLNTCPDLEEIPSEIGEIATLEMIELFECSPSVVASARLIQEEQQSLGNNDLQLNVRSFGGDYLNDVEECTSLRKEYYWYRM